MTTEQSTDRLFDEGCAFHGNTSWSRYGGEPNFLGGRHKNTGAAYCERCYNEHSSDLERIDAEITRRKSLAASRPAELPETLPTGTRFHCKEGAADDVFEFVEPAVRSGEAWHGEHDWIRPDGVRERERSRKATITKLVSAAPVPSPAQPPPDVAKDPYRTHVNAVDDRQIAAVMVHADARYRSRVAAVLQDMSRPSPRTWKSKMGETVTWTSWARTEFGTEGAK